MPDESDKLDLLTEQWQENRDLIRALQEQAKALRNEIITNDTTGGPPRERGPIDFAEFDTKYAELQKENQLLNQTIKQYETTLEIIMAKFRAQTQTIQKEKHDLQLQLESVLEEERQSNAILRKENTFLQERLDESLQVMRQAVRSDEDSNVEGFFTSLTQENESLREILKISSSFAS
ncbi:hypothetical protein HK097_011108 [Rhizophlyctis rosea]|uniref:Uncharacterized protein n=1 Tax=Rhizophlyctis rosea TaxID=64517 RepID=A0AAD5SGW3_9FUNG|nr:hypothetical protein HK097_011108 [Rhizophlyctis rosea]